MERLRQAGYKRVQQALWDVSHSCYTLKLPCHGLVLKRYENVHSCSLCGIVPQSRLRKKSHGSLVVFLVIRECADWKLDGASSTCITEDLAVRS